MKNVLRAGIAAVFVYAVFSTAAPQPGTAQKTFHDSGFTAEQATRGAQVYASKCGTCHGDNLAGMESAPALAGATFKKAWDTMPVATLANRIKTTMPPFAPNSLTADQLTDLVS